VCPRACSVLKTTLQKHDKNLAIWGGFLTFVLAVYFLLSSGDFSFLLVRTRCSGGHLVAPYMTTLLLQSFWGHSALVSAFPHCLNYFSSFKFDFSDIRCTVEVLWIWIAKFQDVFCQDCQGCFVEDFGAVCRCLFLSPFIHPAPPGLLTIRQVRRLVLPLRGDIQPDPSWSINLLSVCPTDAHLQ
jgi:hypothetical protein